MRSLLAGALSCLFFVACRFCENWTCCIDFLVRLLRRSLWGTCYKLFLSLGSPKIVCVPCQTGSEKRSQHAPATVLGYVMSGMFFACALLVVFRALSRQCEALRFYKMWILIDVALVKQLLLCKCSSWLAELRTDDNTNLHGILIWRRLASWFLAILSSVSQLLATTILLFLAYGFCHSA